MSIINDALKKTQTDLLNKTILPNAPDKKGPSPSPKNPEIRPPEFVTAQPASLRPKIKKPALDKTQILLAILIATCVGLLLGMIILFSHISSRSLPPTKQKPRTTHSGIMINGIMARGKKNVALINDEIYEVGETVNGMKIVAIGLDRVDMLVNGQVKSYLVHKK